MSHTRRDTFKANLATAATEEGKEKWFLVTFWGAVGDSDHITADSVMKESEWKDFTRFLKKHGEKDCCAGILCDEFLTYNEYLELCSKVEIKEANTRKFLIQHCGRDPVEYAPREVWDECQRHAEWDEDE